MLKIVYNQYKGYCIPRGNDIRGPDYITEVVTNGFNFFNWDDNQSQEYSNSPNNYGSNSDVLDGDEEETSNSSGSMYDNESKVHMNHEMNEGGVIKRKLIKPVVQEAEAQLSSKKNKKAVKQKGKRKKKQKQSDPDDFYIPSDVNKVKILNNLHHQIIHSINHKKISDDEKILQFFDVSIYKEDLDNLKDDEWLNDNNISFIYEYLERYQLNNFDKLVSNSIVLLRPSMVYLLANHPSPKDLKGVLPPLENTKFIFLPVNDNDDVESSCAGSHWSLVIISLLDRTALIYDTLERANETEAKQVISQASKYLDVNFQIKIIDKTPQQTNGSDCGVMVGQITSFLLSRLLSLKYLEDHFVNLDMNHVGISAIDGRIFIMGTLLNLIKHKQNQE